MALGLFLMVLLMAAVYLVAKKKGYIGTRTHKMPAEGMPENTAGRILGAADSLWHRHGSAHGYLHRNGSRSHLHVLLHLCRCVRLQGAETQHDPGDDQGVRNQHRRCYDHSKYLSRSSFPFQELPAYKHIMRNVQLFFSCFS